MLTLFKDDDVRVADLVDLDLVHVTRLFGGGRRDARQRRGADGLAQAAQVPLGHEAHHEQPVLVAVVQVQLAHLAARHDHLGAFIQTESSTVSQKPARMYSSINARSYIMQLFSYSMSYCQIKFRTILTEIFDNTLS